MIQSTFNSATVWLITQAPDWTEPVRLRVAIPASLEMGETSPEARGALDLALRSRMRWSLTLVGTEIASLANAIHALGAAQVVAPVWPFRVAGAEWVTTEVKGGLVVAWMADWSSHTITDSLADPEDWDYVAPAILGYLAEVPAFSLRRGEVAEVELEVIEDAPSTLALLPPARSWSDGPALPDASVPKVFPLRADWTAAPKLGTPEVEIERRETSVGRQRASAYYPQPGSRVKQARLTMVGDEIATLLAWWKARRATVDSHLVTTDASVTTLAATASAGATSVVVADADTLGTHRWLWLGSPEAGEWCRVTGVAGDTLTLASALARQWSAGATRVTLAMLARHARSELEISFSRPGLATATVQWREVPAEYALAGGETRGITLGALSTKAWLYEWTLDFGGATEVTRTTSHGRSVTASSQTWTTRPGLEHGEIRQSLRLNRDEVTVRGRYWSGCPLEQFLPGRLSALVRLSIFECDVDASGAGTNVVQLFGGEVTKCPFDGSFFSAAASGFYALFDRPALRLRMQLGCNNTLFDGLCGLLESDWRFSAAVTAVSGTQITVESITRSGGLPSGFGFAHWFALGWLERSISGRPVRNWILDSTVLSAGLITVTLDAVPSPVIATSDAVTLVPGCDRRGVTCRAWDATTNPEGKFNNFGRFMGFPEIPDKAPQFKPLQKNDSAVGKK